MCQPPRAIQVLYRRYITIRSVRSVMTGSRQAQVSTAGDNLTTIIVLTVCAACENKCSDFGPLSGLINVGAAKKLGWQSNPGAVIELLLNSMGVEFSADGTALWRRSDPDVKLKIRPRASAQCSARCVGRGRSM